MKRDDLVVGQEYLASDHNDWSVTENGRKFRVRLIDKGHWQRIRFGGVAAQETYEVDTASGKVEVTKNLRSVKGGGDVLCEKLNWETGEHLGYTVFMSRSLRMEFAEGVRIWDLNLADARQRRAEKTRLREEVTARIAAVHEALGIDQADYYRSGDVVIVTLDDAEALVARLNGA